MWWGPLDAGLNTSWVQYFSEGWQGSSRSDGAGLT